MCDIYGSTIFIVAFAILAGQNLIWIQMSSASFCDYNLATVWYAVFAKWQCAP